MSPSNLRVLAANRQALLLAEVAAWLHDMGKCADEHLINQARDRPPPHSYQYKTAYSSLLADAPSLSLLGESVALQTLVEQARPKIVDDIRCPWLMRVLGRCHAAAHIEKEEADPAGKQPASDTRMSTAYGFEQQPLSGLTAWLTGLPYDALTDQAVFKPAVQQAFSKALGETRRPENEVTLWDWSSTVAALYKAALAGALLGFQPQPNDLRWRLLSVRFDGLSFFAQSHRIPDLLIRRNLLNEALNQVQKLLEVEYPLGTEIYRDENGSIFVVPGCDDALDILALQDAGKTLRDYILERIKSRLEEEAIPNIRIDAKPWWGQDPKRKGQDEIPPISEHLQPVVSAADPTWVGQQWKGGQEEICTVCGLRPQGPDSKALSRKVCNTCGKRRADRAEEWTKNLYTTIWTDEVADENGRLALVVGQFDLEKWLDGTLVQTLTVTDPEQEATPDKKKVVKKNPSPARLRRVWETTRTFWQEVCPTEEGGARLKNSEVSRVVGVRGPRLEVRGPCRPRDPSATLGSYHTYELVLAGGVKLSVVWDAQKERFITCDNLKYLESLIHRPVRDGLRKGSTLTIEEPVGYGAANKVWGEITLSQEAAEIPQSEYTPVIPILAEPRIFMALIPANRALEVVRAIQTKYEREMGKVRNRLPLCLGIAFADRRTPLRAILDAGRKLLKQHAEPHGWEVVCVEKNSLPNRFEADAQGQFQDWREIILKKGDRSLTWYVPLRMGDGQTEDRWYPYVFLAQDVQPTGCRRYFPSVNPWNEQHQWLVHAQELRSGDIIYFTPALLDWIWLDVAGRRFEVAYDPQGRRRGLPRRPYLLDELETLERIWRTLKAHLARSQIYALVETVEARRESWGSAENDPTFRQFCREAVANAEWRKVNGRMPWEAEGQDSDRWLDAWADYAARGWLADVVELYLQIRKEDSP